MARGAPITLLVAVILFGVGLVGWTQDAGADKKATATAKTEEEKATDAKAKALAFRKLLVQWHRAEADLIEATLAEKPDNEKIAEFSKKVRELNKQMDAVRPHRPGERPWRHSSDGMGRGVGRGGEFGPDNQPPGSGPGPGPGPGPGFGPGDQPGAGIDGRGPGSDMGPGPEPGDFDHKPKDSNSKSSSSKDSNDNSESSK
jgi:hypothetical protein